MDLISSGYLFVAVASVTVAAEWLLIAAKGPNRRTHLLFAACALAVAVDAFFVERRFIRLESPGEVRAILPWQALAIVSVLALLVLFLSERTGVVRRWLLAVVLGLLAATVVRDFVLTQAGYMTFTSIRKVTFPWGETISFGVGPAAWWRLLGDVANFAFLVLLLDTTLRLARSGQYHLARWLGAGLVLLSLSVLAIIPMDLGWWPVPPLHPFAFLLIVAFMSWELSTSVARSAALSKEVVTNELRWRQLVDTAQLFVLRIDREGRLKAVNPYFEEVLGLSAAEVIGKPLTELVVPEERSAVAESLSRLGEGSVRGASRRAMIGVDGGRHFVEWRYVALHDADGELQGALSLGADVTEQQTAERDRDQALERLKGTVKELERLKERLEEENLVLREEIGQREGFEGIVGTSDALQYVIHKIDQVARAETSVLIQGETGVGKELVARTLHEQSARTSRPFVVMNCAALAPSLVDSELFGHERGAFTGAERRRQGRFELAGGGTLFLDEVGELPLEVQPKLLRVLEQGDFERVGGTRKIHVDVRLIAATNRDLGKEVAAGRFREDLYYRLVVYPITVPPLRDRTEDIPSLVFHFMRRYNEKRTVKLEEVPAELLRRLQAYTWPGNVRELKNVLERAALASPGRVLKLAAPLQAPNGPAASVAPQPVEGDGVLTLDELQRRHIRMVLNLCQGQIAGSGGAAERLGLHANTLRSRMKKLGLVHPPRR